MRVEGVATPGLVGRVVTEADRFDRYRADTDGDGDLDTVDHPDFGRIELVFKNVLIEWRPFRALGFRAGLIPDAYIPAAEDAWTMRFVERVAAHRNGFMPNEADTGAAVFGDLPGGYGSYEAQVSNGEGYLRAEENRHKAGQARLTLRPFPGSAGAGGLRLTGAARYVTNDNPPGPDLDRRVSAVGLVSYDREGFRTDASVFGRWSYFREGGDPFVSRGASAYVSWLSQFSVGPFARYDIVDPNASQDHAEVSLWNSRIGADDVPADEDINHFIWAGLLFRPTPRFDAAIWYYGRFLDEQYQGGSSGGERIDPEQQAWAGMRLSF
ncbi:MAG: hypothetical protein M5R36_06460 [Deltaproteobacteria bacterium]|nr:hypothetical protein [Deltaproteobacteria bacterium]